MKIGKDFVKETLTKSMSLAEEISKLAKSLETRRKACNVIDQRIAIHGKRTNLVGHAIRGAIKL